MARMGRKRKRGKGLPERVYISRGWYFYADPRPGEGWKKLAREGDLGGMYRQLATVQAGDAAGTMQALFKKYRAEELPKKAPKTQKLQGKELTKLEAVYGRMPPDEITSQMVGQYLTERSAPVAANREIALLSHVFTKGIRWMLAERNPCLGVERNEEKPRRHKIVDLDLMRAWLIAKPWMRAMMALGYVTGQRQGDLRRLKDTDFASRGLCVMQGKTGTELLLKWTPNLIAAQKYALRVRATTLNGDGEEKVKPIGRWLICTRRSAPYSAMSIRREWTRMMRALELQGGQRFQFRDLRPRSATDHATGEHLGHKDQRILDRHYRLGPKVVKPL